MLSLVIYILVSYLLFSVVIAGAWQCLPCPAGFMCTRRVTADPCQQGYYCPGSTGYDIQPCPVGTFGRRTGLTHQSECTNCTAGQYCDAPGLPQPAGPCAAGHWCKIGVDTKSPSGAGHLGEGDICPKGHQCPEGTDLPEPCLSGTYSKLVGASQCSVCPPGKLFRRIFSCSEML